MNKNKAAVDALITTASQLRFTSTNWFQKFKDLAMRPALRRQSQSPAKPLNHGRRAVVSGQVAKALSEKVDSPPVDYISQIPWF